MVLDFSLLVVEALSLLAAGSLSLPAAAGLSLLVVAVLSLLSVPDFCWVVEPVPLSFEALFAVPALFCFLSFAASFESFVSFVAPLLCSLESFFLSVDLLFYWFDDWLAGSDFLPPPAVLVSVVLVSLAAFDASSVVFFSFFDILLINKIQKIMITTQYYSKVCKQIDLWLIGSINQICMRYDDLLMDFK